MRASHRARPVRDRLARLDDAVVPVAAERVQRAARALAAARARAVTALRGGGAARGPAEPTPLARLDARLARRGPLALLRALPGAGAALAAVVALAGGLALLGRSDPEPDRLVAAGAGDAGAPTASPDAGAPTASPPATPPPGEGTSAPGPRASASGTTEPDTVLGPAGRADAAAHLAAASAELARLAAAAPGATVPALVHVAEPMTPQRAAELAAGVPVRQAVVRVPLPGEQAALRPVRVQRLPEDATAALAGLAQQLRSRAAADEARATGSAPGDDAADVLRAAADLGRRQADALDAGPACACLVGLLVTGTPGELRALADRPGVRGVEPGPPGVPPEQLTLRPLPPDQPTASPRDAP